MVKTEKILFKYLKKIVDQIYTTKIGTNERFLQCMLFSKLYGHKPVFHKWSHVDAEKYYLNIGEETCDLYFEENNLRSRNKSVWAENKFLTSTNTKSPGAIQTPLIRDFLRLLFFPKPNPQNYDIENYVFMIAKGECDVNKNIYHNPRTYFGIYQDPDNHPELSKLIYPPRIVNTPELSITDEIEFDVRKYLSKLNQTAESYKKLIEDFPVLSTLRYINILKYSYGTAYFDQSTNAKDLNGHIFGYLFKILNCKMQDS